MRLGFGSHKPKVQLQPAGGELDSGRVQRVNKPNHGGPDWPHKKCTCQKMMRNVQLHFPSLSSNSSVTLTSEVASSDRGVPIFETKYITVFLFHSRVQKSPWHHPILSHKSGSKPSDEEPDKLNWKLNGRGAKSEP